MKFSDNDLADLRNKIKEYMGEFRYKHTLGVEEFSVYLGQILLPDCLSELRAAALLHDIAKEVSHEEQFAMLDSVGFALTDEDLSTLPALHSFSAVPLIRKSFPMYATDDVLSAVSKHTLGSSNMSLFDKIIFISDFAEPGRKYGSCIATANFIKENITADNSFKDNLKSLNKAIIMAIDYTIESLLQKNKKVHSSTELTRITLTNDTI